MSTSAVLSLAVLASIAADGIWYIAGRQWGSRAMVALCGLSADPRRSLANARERFRRHGLPVLFFSKFVPGLDGIVPPMAGAEKVPVLPFLAYDAAGSLLWAATYMGLGHLFSHQLQEAARWAGQFGTAFGIVLGVSICLYLTWFGIPLLKKIRQLKDRRITASTLATKLKSNRRIAVLDLLQFEPEPEAAGVGAIPGACSIDPSRLQSAQTVQVPEDIEIVLYCSSESVAITAKAAIALQRVGVTKVWVLEGGLKAWQENQFPVSPTLVVPEDLAARLGFELPEIKP